MYSSYLCHSFSSLFFFASSVTMVTGWESDWHFNFNQSMGFYWFISFLGLFDELSKTCVMLKISLTVFLNQPHQARICIRIFSFIFIPLHFHCDVNVVCSQDKLSSYWCTSSLLVDTCSSCSKNEMLCQVVFTFRQKSLSPGMPRYYQLIDIIINGNLIDYPIIGLLIR